MKIYKNNRLEEQSKDDHTCKRQLYITSYLEKLKDGRHRFYSFSKYKLSFIANDKYILAVGNKTHAVKKIAPHTYIRMDGKGRVYTIKETNGRIYMLYSLNTAVKTLDTLIDIYTCEYIVEAKTEKFIELMNEVKKYKTQISSLEVIAGNSLINDELKGELRKTLYQAKIINTILQNAIIIETL